MAKMLSTLKEKWWAIKNETRWKVVMYLIGDELKIVPMWKINFPQGDPETEEWRRAREKQKKELAGLVTIAGKPAVYYGVWKKIENKLTRVQN